MKRLPRSFYDRTDVLLITKELIGKVVRTNINGEITSGRIVEAEAYAGVTDRASHAFNGRRTAKNEQMYSPAGTVYMYICYGMHMMLNIVTNKKDVPDAILVRALEPLEGVDVMLARTGKSSLDYTLTKGPGKVAKALGLSKLQSGLEFGAEAIDLLDDGFRLDEEAIGTSKRIGVDSAGEAAEYPYRYYLKGNKYVSSRPWK